MYVFERCVSRSKSSLIHWPQSVMTARQAKIITHAQISDDELIQHYTTACNGSSYRYLETAIATTPADLYSRLSVVCNSLPILWSTGSRDFENSTHHISSLADVQTNVFIQCKFRLCWKILEGTMEVCIDLLSDYFIGRRSDHLERVVEPWHRQSLL